MLEVVAGELVEGQLAGEESVVAADVAAEFVVGVFAGIGVVVVVVGGSAAASAAWPSSPEAKPWDAAADLDETDLAGPVEYPEGPVAESAGAERSFEGQDLSAVVVAVARAAEFAWLQEVLEKEVPEKEVHGVRAAALVCTVQELRSFEKNYFQLGMDSSSALGLQVQMQSGPEQARACCRLKESTKGRTAELFLV